VVAPAVQFGETPASIARPAPLVGQHTREILAESGFDTDYIDKLLDEKAAGEP
jgi:crotonobetainyl-CoA:carnitine CoA-transferase CaiB-like acyl-CoA transferase